MAFYSVSLGSSSSFVVIRLFFPVKMYKFEARLLLLRQEAQSCNLIWFRVHISSCIREEDTYPASETAILNGSCINIQNIVTNNKHRCVF